MLLPHYRRLLAYEIEANKRILAAIDTIPAAARQGPAYTRLTQLLPHNQLARQVWLWRINVTPYDNPKDWFPSQTTDQTRAQCEKMDGAWSTYLAGLTEGDLAREVRYSSSEGQKYISTVADILTHVFNHSTYHRGQAARLITECGGQRPTTDFIAITRKAAE